MNIDDFNDRGFKYEHDYDENGICYFLGTNYGISNKWTNPGETKKIKLRSSGWRCGSINDMLVNQMIRNYFDRIKIGFHIYGF